MAKERIGVGMVLAVICCMLAFGVEHVRLSLVKEDAVFINYPDREISMYTAILVPQFLLLGLMEALVDNGLEQLFHDHGPKSMPSFAEPFSEFVLGIGKLLTVPSILIITGWFKESMNTSHVDRYYLMLAILNFVFIFIYGYYSTKYKEDEEIPENGHQGSQEEEIGPLETPAEAISAATSADEENDLTSESTMAEFAAELLGA